MSVVTDCEGLITNLRNANNAARIDLEAIPPEAVRAAAEVFYIGWDFLDEGDDDQVRALRATELALAAAAPLLLAPLVAEVERLRAIVEARS